MLPAYRFFRCCARSRRGAAVSNKSAERGRSLSRDPAHSDFYRPSFHNRRRPQQNDEKIAKLRSAPEIVNRFGSSGLRFQGNERAFNIREAASYQDHVQLSGQMPSPMDEGADNLPEDIQGAILFVAHRSTRGILEYWQEATARLTRQANDLMPDLIRIRSTLPSEDAATKVRLHLPLLSSLLREHGMGAATGLSNSFTASR